MFSTKRTSHYLRSVVQTTTGYMRSNHVLSGCLRGKVWSCFPKKWLRSVTRGGLLREVHTKVILLGNFRCFEGVSLTKGGRTWRFDFIYLFVYSFIFLFTFHLASSPRDKRRADRDSLDLPPSLSPPPQLPGSQPPPYGMLPQYQHLQNHMGPMMAPPQFQPQYQPPLNHIDSGEIPMEHGIQSIDECMMRPQQFNPADIGGYPTTTNHNGQNHLELMHDMINSF